MSLHKEAGPRFISKEGTARLRFGAIVAGVIGWIAELSSLAVGGFGVAGATVVYDIYRRKKDKKPVAHAGGGH